MSEEVSYKTGCAIKLLLAGIVIAAAIFIPHRKPKEETPGTGETPPPGPLIEIVLYHQPGVSDSERMAGVLDDIAGKYGKQVLVTRVDVTKHPGRAAAEKITRPPKLVIMAGESREYEYNGFMPRDQAEKKIDEILHKLKRVGKDWRPPVGGMTPAPESKPPGARAQPPIPPASRQSAR